MRETGALPRTRRSASHLSAGIDIEATLADSEAARGFASLLPITLPMTISSGARSLRNLPRAISEAREANA